MTDEHTVPAYLSQIFERVRQSADFMPAHQVDQQMSRELGPNWRTLFNEFDEVPFAAASIGQVLCGWSTKCLYILMFEGT